LDISIPFGAIKSILEQHSLRAKVIKFQFLLVRLKERKSFNNLFVIQISIPFGAIKSFSDGSCDMELYYIFQFLLVRLKGLSTYLAYLHPKDFNSFWCD